MTSTLSIISDNIDEKSGLYPHSVNSIFSEIESKLFQIFDEETKKTNSIILKFKRSAISKMALFLSGSITRSASVGIAGETASGKSTVALDMIDTIQSFATEFEIKNAITRINTDDYYHDRSEMVKKAGSFANFAKDYDLDVPAALELSLMKKHIRQLQSGYCVLLPKYDMSGTAIRIDNHQHAEPSNIIISEGLFTLTEDIHEAFDFKIYVDVTKTIQAERFFIRSSERGLGDSAKTIFENASKKAEIYIKPCAENADFILSGEACRNKYKEFLNRILGLVQEYHFEEVYAAQ